MTRPTEDTPTPDYWANHTCEMTCSHIRPEDWPKQDDKNAIVNFTRPVKPVSGKADYASERLREAVKRFCRTEEAADNLVAYIKAQQLQLVSELLLQAEQRQIVVAYEKTYEHKPILQDWKAVPVTVLEHKKQELERLQND